MEKIDDKTERQKSIRMIYNCCRQLTMGYNDLNSLKKQCLKSSKFLANKRRCLPLDY